MALKLRLTRMGSKKKPFYRIVAVNSESRRDGRALRMGPGQLVFEFGDSCQCRRQFGVFDIRLEVLRSEERRVGKECRSRWSPYH